MEVVVGVALVVLGAVGATAIARTVEARGRGPRTALAVVPAGVLVGAGAALIRGWDLLPSAAVGAVVVAVLGLTNGLRFQPSSRRGRHG